ncbi:MAG TPA: amidohydrolase, partial [Thermomicrobiales bacterium]|nr:amidohydrolase [Thermomicrobiales bacterium]
IRGTGDGSGKGKVVLARADMDALPIVEENEVDYRSKNDGVMHACGHDAHTAILLAVARVLMDRRDQFAGTVKLCFQPSEETGPGGAKWMIEQGVMQDPPVDACFGLHVWQNEPVGTVLVSDGPVMANSDRFEIRIQGKGGHGAMPHGCVDPIVVGMQIVGALQTLVSREVDPTEAAVVTVGEFHAGHAPNVIPDTATIRGTVRSFAPEVQDLLERRIIELAEGIGASMRAEVKAEYRRGVPATVNDPAMAEIARQAAIEVVGEENVRPQIPTMGGEDMSFFLLEKPGCYFWVGTNNEDRGLTWGHHHPRFDIDEEALGVGVETMVRTLTRYLAQDG